MEYIIAENIINLGYSGENAATVVKFPIAQTLAAFGTTGTWKLLVLRPKDSAAYTVSNSNITTDGEYLYWTVTATDVEQSGCGECQLKYTVGSAVKMTRLFHTFINSSLAESTPTPTGASTFTLEITANGDTFTNEYAFESGMTFIDFIGSHYNPFVGGPITSFLFSTDYERVLYGTDDYGMDSLSDDGEPVAPEAEIDAEKTYTVALS